MKQYLKNMHRAEKMAVVAEQSKIIRVKNKMLEFTSPSVALNILKTLIQPYSLRCI